MLTIDNNDKQYRVLHPKEPPYLNDFWINIEAAPLKPIEELLPQLSSLMIHKVKYNSQIIRLITNKYERENYYKHIIFLREITKTPKGNRYVESF